MRGAAARTMVSIGIPVHAEPERLRDTLRALPAALSEPSEVLLLPDGPEPSTRAALAGIDLPQSGTDEPRGTPACFNRLVALAEGEVVVLLESGAVPAPGALDRLLAALAADPRDGLAGPSTNHAWNEQCVFRGGAGDPRSVADFGRAAWLRFGSRTVPLTTLHSLADFCLAVRREVVAAIGGADEGYGLGPCWEMEYSARAARAGFRGVWVCGAYVHRAPFTARRRIEEARRFAASRRRYQDTLCGLRLRGEATAYAPHCRGEACAHFAPAALITLRRPVAAPPPAVRPVPSPAETARARPGADDGAAASHRVVAPLVSCIMPTRDRADLVLHAVELFRRQDYAARELIIVDDGLDDLGARLPDDPQIRLLRVPRGETIGAKRNRACAAARGEVIAQWDDDDWYGPRRLTAQVAPLLAGSADITALRTPAFLDLERWRFWAVSDALHRRLFVQDVHGGTLVFRRTVWERLARYPHRSLAEDAAFLSHALARGARLARISGEGHFIYVRHGANAWRFPCGTYLDPGGWRRTQEPWLGPGDREFYAARSAAAPPDPKRPRVSCIMPTADRRPYVASALRFFARQDYPDRELVIVDDGADRVADLIPADPRVRYVGLPGRLVLGEKRNRACEAASGEIIVHWDDDDWQAPTRLSWQVAELERTGAELCGPDRMRYFEPATSRAWLYAYAGGSPRWVAGNALCYRRSLWERARFAAVPIGEDNVFLRAVGAPGPAPLADDRQLVALVHPGNASPKATAGPCWTPRPVDEVRSLVGSDWDELARVMP